MRQNMVEEQVSAFWALSLAWKRVPGYVEGQTVGGMFEAIAPLKYSRAPAVAAQAEDLAAQMVRGRVRRKKRKCQIVPLPKKVGQAIKSEAA